MNSIQIMIVAGANAAILSAWPHVKRYVKQLFRQGIDRWREQRRNNYWRKFGRFPEPFSCRLRRLAAICKDKAIESFLPRLRVKK